jgi:hypothetical protein
MNISVNIKTHRMNNMVFNFLYFIFFQNYGPPKNDGHIDTSDSSRPLLSTRTSDVVAHEVSPMSSCFKTETKTTNVQSSNNKDATIGVSIIFHKKVVSASL